MFTQRRPRITSHLSCWWGEGAASSFPPLEGTPPSQGLPVVRVHQPLILSLVHLSNPKSLSILPQPPTAPSPQALGWTKAFYNDRVSPGAIVPWSYCSLVSPPAPAQVSPLCQEFPGDSVWGTSKPTTLQFLSPAWSSLLSVTHPPPEQPLLALTISCWILQLREGTTVSQPPRLTPWEPPLP